MRLIELNLLNNIEFAKLAEGTKRLHNGNHKPYPCPAGFMTIGYGRNIQANGISENEAERMLMNDLTGCVALLERNVNFWERHNDCRQSVLIDMCFNMGWGKLSGFKKMFAALEREDYAEAAVQMKDSKWYRDVGRRADTLIESMCSGVWQSYK